MLSMEAFYYNNNTTGLFNSNAILIICSCTTKKNYYYTSKIKLSNSLVSTVARKSGNCNLIGCVGCYDHIVTYIYL